MPSKTLVTRRNRFAVKLDAMNGDQGLKFTVRKPPRAGDTLTVGPPGGPGTTFTFRASKKVKPGEIALGATLKETVRNANRACRELVGGNLFEV